MLHDFIQTNMKTIRLAIIGFFIGGGIGVKACELLGQSIESPSIDLLTIGMISGGLTGVALALSLSGFFKSTNSTKNTSEESSTLSLTKK